MDDQYADQDRYGKSRLVELYQYTQISEPYSTVCQVWQFKQCTATNLEKSHFPAKIFVDVDVEIKLLKAFCCIVEESNSSQVKNK